MYNKAVSWGSKKGLVLVLVLSGILGSFGIAQAANPIEWVITTVAKIYNYVVLNGLQAIATMFIRLVIVVGNYNDFINIAPVVNAWVVVRDLTNIAIILAVIIVAFGTIFGISRFGDIKSLPKILIAGVLINFSRTIVGFLIDGSQLVMSAFMQGLSAVAAPGLVQTLGLLKYTQLNATIDQETTQRVAKILMESFVATGFLVIVNGTLFVILMTLLFRIVTFWLVVAVSPAAFLASVLPGTKGMYNEWRKYLVNNLLNGPLLAFFLWLAISIMASMNSIVGSFGPIGGDGQAVSEFFKGSNILTTLIGVALLILALGFASSLAAIGAKSIENWGKNYFVNNPLKPFKKLADVKPGAAAWQAAKFTGRSLKKTAKTADLVWSGGANTEKWRQRGRKIERGINAVKSFSEEFALEWIRTEGLRGAWFGSGKSPDDIKKEIDKHTQEIEIFDTKRNYSATRSAKSFLSSKIQEAADNPGVDVTMSDKEFKTFEDMLRLSGDQGLDILAELKADLQKMRKDPGNGINDKASDAEVMNQLLSNSSFQSQRERFQTQINNLNKSALSQFESVEGLSFSKNENDLWEAGNFDQILGQYSGKSSENIDKKRVALANLKKEYEDIHKRQAQQFTSEAYMMQQKAMSKRRAERLKERVDLYRSKQFDSVDELATAYLGLSEKGDTEDMQAVLKLVNEKGLMVKFADELGKMNSRQFGGDDNRDRVMSVIARAYIGDGYFNNDGTLDKDGLNDTKPAAMNAYANFIEEVSKKAEATGDLHLLGLVSAKYGEYELTEQNKQDEKILEQLLAGRAKDADLHRIILDKDGNLTAVGKQYLEKAGSLVAGKIRSNRIENQSVIDAVYSYLLDDDMEKAIEEGFEVGSDKPMDAKKRNNLQQVVDVLKGRLSGAGANAMLDQIEKEYREINNKVSQYSNRVHKAEEIKAKIEKEIQSAQANNDLQMAKQSQQKLVTQQATLEVLRADLERFEAKRDKKKGILSRHRQVKDKRNNGTNKAQSGETYSFDKLGIEVDNLQLAFDVLFSDPNIENRAAQARDLVRKIEVLRGQFKGLEDLQEQEQLNRQGEALKEQLEKFIQDQGGANAQ